MAKNTKITVKGSLMTIEVDLSQNFGKSGSGKTYIIASTEGSLKVDTDYGAMSVGLNVYTKEEPKPAEDSGKKKGK